MIGALACSFHRDVTPPLGLSVHAPNLFRDGRPMAAHVSCNVGGYVAQADAGGAQVYQPNLTVINATATVATNPGTLSVYRLDLP